MSEVQHSHTKRRTLPSAIGEPMIWLTGGALVVCLTMIALLIVLVVVNGSKSFWPRPIEQVTLESGEVFLGIATEHEEQTDTTAKRTLYRVGNRDLGQESFRWVDDNTITESVFPKDAVMLEREAWGVWFGVPESIIRIDEENQTTVIAAGADDVFDEYSALHNQARQDKNKIEKLKRVDLGEVNSEIEDLRLQLRQAEIVSQRGSEGVVRFDWATWSVFGVIAIALMGLVYRVRHLGTSLGSTDARKGKLIRSCASVGVLMLIVAMWVGAPWKGHALNDEQLIAMRSLMDTREAELLVEYDQVIEKIRQIEEADKRLRIVVVEPTTGHFSPTSQTLSDEHLHVSQIVRLVRPNTLSTTGKVGVYLSRWWEYLSTFPREANTEGGVYPVIVGTVLLTLLLTIFVTPLGVIAALYLREYAKQGFITSMIRIAVNNLAGVPSIVYGVFGLGFFCYTVGQYIDTGPSTGSRLDSGQWWMLFVGAGIAIMGGLAIRLWSKPEPGKIASSMNVRMQRLSWFVWSLVFVMCVLLVVKTPYFHGMYEAQAEDGSPTFGARGMLWASLTLALLTLPVVIVATEEAIAAVPNSMRQGSYGCGASKWQTMRRIVLPGALPGILTGAILAMARGAGEVAPLMLVGAVKLNQDLPISTDAPFLHADRSFMHLGFHIYDLGFQSPDSQAARPLVWTTTLLFLTIVFALNFTAIMIRSKVKARMAGPTV